MKTSSNEYCNTAYDSNQISLQVPRSEKGTLGKLMSAGQTLLSFTQSDESIPAGLYREKIPSQWKELRSKSEDIRPLGMKKA